MLWLLARQLLITGTATAHMEEVLMERMHYVPRPSVRPVFWALLILSVILKTSIATAAVEDAPAAPDEFASTR